MRQETLIARFWSRVVKTRGCWLWTGLHDRKGYAIFRRRGAYRFSYQLHYGPIPKGKEIDHVCRNHGCVNPEHLRAVTHRVNVLAGVGLAAINAAKTTCLRGHPFSPENTYWRGSRRDCLECIRIRNANWRRTHPKHPSLTPPPSRRKSGITKQQHV